MAHVDGRDPEVGGGMTASTIILMGVCGAGKSLMGRLLADAIGAVFDDSDDYHLPENRSRLSRGVPLTDADRRPWYERLRQRIVEVRAQGRRHVMACSALHSGLRQWLRADDPPTQIMFVLLEADPETIETRMKTRVGHFMPSSLISSQFATLEITDDLVRVRGDREPRAVLADLLTRTRAN